MKSGDVCVGFDLKETQFVDNEAEDMRSSGKLPDVVVIRKLYGGVANSEADAHKKRKWQLKRLNVEVEEGTKSARTAKKDAEADDMDEEDFMREVEADRDMRDQMNLYKSELLREREHADNDAMDEERKNVETIDDDDDQEIRLEELLDDLVMDDGPDPEDVNGEDLDKWGMEGERAAKDHINYVGREESRLVKEKDGAILQSTFGKEYET